MILIFINPFGGSEDEISVVRTTRAGHARSLLSGELRNDSSLKHIFAFSGDGLLNEIFNGLMSWDVALPSVCPFPGGSMCGLLNNFVDRKQTNEKKTFEAYELLESGTSLPFDLLKVTRISEPGEGGDARLSEYACLHFSWAGIGFHDTLHEKKLRWMGPFLKEIIAPVATILWKQEYKAKITFTLAENRGDRESPQRYTEPSEFVNYSAVTDDKKTWQIEDTFSIISICNVPYMSATTRLAPNCRQGSSDLILIKSTVSRFSMMKMFYEIDAGTGKHLEYRELLHCFPVSSVDLVPSPDDQSETPMSIDGELIPMPKSGVRIELKENCCSLY